MSIFLPYKTKGSCAIATCDRCGSKVYYDELRKDGNSPGLMVCGADGCADLKDPWRLPPRKTENISLRHPRPDNLVAIDPSDVTTIP